MTETAEIAQPKIKVNSDMANLILVCIVMVP